MTLSPPSSSARSYLTEGYLGTHAPVPLPFGTAAALTASRAYAVRFIAVETQTITRMTFALTTAAAANDNCDVGIFSADVQTLLGSAGSTAGKLNVAVPSVQTLTLAAPVLLLEGQVYYGAFAVGTFGGAGASVTMTSMSPPSTQLFGPLVPLIAQTFQAAAFPLAAPLVPAGAITSCPILGLLR